MKKMEYCFNIGDSFNIGISSFLVLDRKIENIENKKNKCGKSKIKTYFCECKECHKKTWRREKQIKSDMKNKKFGCHKCSGAKKFLNKNNSIAIVRPELVKYFKNKEDAYNITEHSGQKKIFICPYCNKYEKELEVKQVSRDGYVSCPYCGDGISYPNKFGINFLSQLDIENLENEFSDDWTLGKRYDFSFFYKQKHYLVEMDGEIHYRNSYRRNVDIIEKNDHLKDDIAKKNNCILIRIDCLRSDFNYIKNSILNSEFAELFNLESINWELIRENCISNLFRKVCDYYNDNPNSTLKDLSQKFKLHEATIRKYLKRGNDLNFVNYQDKLTKFKDNYKKVINLRNNTNLTIKEISEKVGINDFLVRSYIKDAGKKGYLLDDRTDIERRHDYILKVVKENPNLTNIALSKIANCNPITITKYKEELKYA